MQKDNEIRTLRAQHKQKEMVLKRKQEEVRVNEEIFSNPMDLLLRYIYYGVKCVQVVCEKPRKR